MSETTPEGQSFEETQLYNTIYEESKAYMSKYDASHDFQHIRRVLGLAKHMYAQESSRQDSAPLDERVVVCAALLHDFGDKKYAAPGESAHQIIRDLLLRYGCSKHFAEKVAMTVANVSYTHEVKHPDQVQQVLLEHPELAIVQDADRLDAIGAVGVARCFAYGAVKASDRGLQGSVDHFPEKLEKLEAMMKTETGRQLAKERTQRLKQFRQWWEEEDSFASMLR